MARYDLDEQKKSALSQRNQELESGMILADMFINKNYLINLNKSPVMSIDKTQKNTSFLRLFKVERLVFDGSEDINDKLISVYSALQNLNSSVVIVIDSSSGENGIKFYIGTSSPNNASTVGKVLEKSIKGNFPGSVISNLENEKIEKILNYVSKSEDELCPKTISAVTVVPSARDKNKEKFVQGIEKFIDAMSGEKYTAVFISSALPKGVLEKRKRGYEEMYSSMSSFSRTTLQYSENFSDSVTKGQATSFSDSLSRSITNSNTQSSTSTDSTSSSYNSGSSYSGENSSYSSGSSSGRSSSYSSGNSWTDSVADGKSKTAGVTDNYGETQSSGNSKSLTINYDNKSIQNLLNKIDEQLERIKLSEAFGLWEASAYFISEDIQTSVVAANTYKALVSGNDSGVENSFVNIWGVNQGENTIKMLEYMKYLCHPKINLKLSAEIGNQIVTPANVISGNEMPYMMGFPRKSVNGLTILQIAEFGRNVFTTSNPKSFNKKIELGRVYHMGNVEKQQVNLELNSLTSHCFITGSTGSGKSNTSYQILEELIRNNINFLVVEPAKGEYKKAFGNFPNINIFSTNPKVYRMLKINPFKFDDEIHVLEHLDRMIEIFNACWPMYSAMPAILKDTVETAYINCGWDLNTSIHVNNGKSKYPTFKNLLDILPELINSSAYSAQAKGDYTGALVTRVKSMTNGINGQIFCGDADVEDRVLFDENSIVDLSRIGSSETKSLIMGILVMKLNEYRMSNSDGENLPLRHVTVLEEAHNLLKRVSTDQNQEGANMTGKSVEMISNSIAEMRTYGEGFIIIDQSPTAVDISAIKNTNTKIVMRLPEKSDCETVANSLALDENQTKEISKLTVGIAVVFQNNWLQPVLTKVNYCKNQYNAINTTISNKIIRKLKGDLTYEMCLQFTDSKYSYEKLKKIVDGSDIDYNKKNEYLAIIEEFIYNKAVRNMSDEKRKNEFMMTDKYREAMQIESELLTRMGDFIASFMNCQQIYNFSPLEIDTKGKTKREHCTSKDKITCDDWYKKSIEILDLYIYATPEHKSKILQFLIKSNYIRGINKFKAAILSMMCYTGGIR